MKKWILVFITIYLFSGSLFSNSLKFFYIDNNDCSLNEMGNASNQNTRIKISGKKANIFGAKACSVYVKEKEFNKNYDFCSFNGFNLYQSTGRENCYFGKSDDKYFFQNIGEIGCMFMCKTK